MKRNVIKEVISLAAALLLCLGLAVTSYAEEAPAVEGVAEAVEEVVEAVAEPADEAVEAVEEAADEAAEAVEAADGQAEEAMEENTEENGEGENN